MAFKEFLIAHWVQIVAPIIFIVIFLLYKYDILFEGEEKRKAKKEAKKPKTAYSL